MSPKIFAYVRLGEMFVYFNPPGKKIFFKTKETSPW